MKNIFKRVLLLLFIISTITTVTISQEKSYGKILIDSLDNLKDYPGDQVILDHLLEAIPRILEEDDQPSYFTCILALSSLYYNLNRHDLWGDYIIQAAELAKDTINIPRADYASVLNNLAMFENSKGNHKKAIQTLLSSIEEEKKATNDPYEISVIYNNINKIYSTLGDFKNAAQYSNRSYELRKTGESKYFTNNPGLRLYQMARSLYSLGKAQQKMHDYENAKINFHLSLNLLGKYHPEVITSKNKRVINNHHILAEIFFEENNPEQMLEHLKKAQRIQNTTDYKKYKNLELFGNYYALTKDYKNAELFLLEALEITKKDYKVNKEYPLPAITLLFLGNLKFEQKEFELAVKYYHEGLQFIDARLDSNNLNNPDLSHIQASNQALELLHKKALTSKKIYQSISQGNELKNNYLSISYNSYTNVARLLNEMRTSFLSDKSKFYVAESASPIFQEGMDIMFDKYSKNPSEVILNDILEYLEFNKSSILFESIKNKFEVATSNIPKSIIEKELDLSSSLSFYQKKLSEEKLNQNDQSTELIESLNKKIFQFNEDFALLRKEMKEKYPFYYNLKNYEAKISSISSVQKTLDNQQLLLEYFVGKDYVYYLAISNSKATFHKSKNDDIKNKINEFYAEISQNPLEHKSKQNYIYNGETLYNELINPAILSHGQKQNLIIVPDNSLNKVPFDCLYKKDKNESLQPIINDFTISYLYSINQLEQFDSNPQTEQKVLCLAPTFQDNNAQVLVNHNRSCQNKELDNLPYAQEELEFLSKNFKGTFLKGSEALSLNFLNSIKDHSIIHLATHGCLNQENPMLSEIHFYDQALTNYDIENLNVHPELVVLSACNTAKGEFKEGEGVISLSRGFFEAGVKSLQSSLWSIDDYTSSGIMKTMYENLKKGETKSNALRLAKLEHLNNADKMRSHPYFWAGMIQIGNPSPIFKTKHNYGWFLGAILVMVLLVFIVKRKSK